MLFDLIRSWAQKKGIYEKGDAKTQLIKLYEETGELSKAILDNDKEDAIGDCVIVLTSIAHLNNLKIEDCIQKAYNVIKERKGKMKNNTFMKE